MRFKVMVLTHPESRYAPVQPPIVRTHCVEYTLEDAARTVEELKKGFSRLPGGSFAAWFIPEY